MNAHSEIDLVVDLNTMDETGLPWAFFEAAVAPSRVHPGANIIVGSGSVRAVAQVVDITDGIVHVLPFKGSVSNNAHLQTYRQQRQ